MKTFLILVSTAVLLVLSTVSTLEKIVWYHPVTGKCKDLKQVRNYKALQISSGVWYYQYTSFGEEGDTCSSGQSVQRGNRTYADLMLFDPVKSHYVLFPLDLTYHENEGGKYTDSFGGIGYMLATDLKNYFYYVQCIEENGQTKVMDVFATRQLVMNEDAEKVYNEFSERLTQQNLLAPMHHINNTDCPPLGDVEPGAVILN